MFHVKETTGSDLPPALLLEAGGWWENRNLHIAEGAVGVVGNYLGAQGSADELLQVMEPLLGVFALCILRFLRIQGCNWIMCRECLRMTVRNCGVVYIRSNLGSQHSAGISQIRLLVGQGFGALHLSGSCVFFWRDKTVGSFIDRMFSCWWEVLNCKRRTESCFCCHMHA